MKPRTLFPALAIAVTLPALAQAPQPLAAPENAISAYIDAHRDEANAMLEKLVNINSGTHNLEGVRAVARILEAQLRELGFVVEFKPMDRAPDDVQRAGVLVATHACPQAGQCGKRMLLIGHMD